MQFEYGKHFSILTNSARRREFGKNANVMMKLLKGLAKLFLKRRLCE